MQTFIRKDEFIIYIFYKDGKDERIHIGEEINGFREKYNYKTFIRQNMYVCVCIYKYASIMYPINAC